jgi:hypothetical protein
MRFDVAPLPSLNASYAGQFLIWLDKVFSPLAAPEPPETAQVHKRAHRGAWVLTPSVGGAIRDAPGFASFDNPIARQALEQILDTFCWGVPAWQYCPQAASC